MAKIRVVEHLLGAANRFVKNAIRRSKGGATPKPAAMSSRLDEVTNAESFLDNGATVRYSDTATAIGDDEHTIQNFVRSQGNGGHDLIIHGTEEGDFVVNEIFVHEQQVAQALVDNPAYDGGPLNLVVCHGACGPAQKLRTSLRELGFDPPPAMDARPNEVELDPVTGALNDVFSRF